MQQNAEGVDRGALGYFGKICGVFGGLYLALCFADLVHVEDEDPLD